jgi:hypothetical protein
MRVGDRFYCGNLIQTEFPFHENVFLPAIACHPERSEGSTVSVGLEADPSLTLRMTSLSAKDDNHDPKTLAARTDSVIGK